MADRSDYLQEMVNLVGRLIEDGFGEDEIREMLAAALAHIGGGSDVPYARGTPVWSVVPSTSPGQSTSGR